MDLGINFCRLWRIRYLLVICLASLLVNCSEVDDDGSRAVIFKDGSLVVLADGNLATCVQDSLAASNASSPDQLESISCDMITSLDGIEIFTGLQELSIIGADLTDGALTELRSLSLQSTDIIDPSFLSNLYDLTSLSIIGGQFQDFPSFTYPLAELTINFNYINLNTFSVPDSLTRLDLSNCYISLKANSIYPLDLSPNLLELRLDDNQIEYFRMDINPELELLSARSNEITDLTPISTLIKLKHLDLGNNTISDISSISGLSALEILNLDDNSLINISPISTLGNLTHLNLSYNSISDLTPFSSNTFPSLEDLNSVKE